MSTHPSPPSIPPLGPPPAQRASLASGRFKPIDPLGLVRRHVWLLLALLVLGGAAGVGTWYLLREFNPWYSSEALVHIAPVNPDAWSGLGEDMGRLRMDVAQAAIENEQLRLRSEQTLRAALERPRVRDTAWFASFRRGDGETVDAPAALEALRRHLVRTRAVPGSTQMQVSVRTPRAADAQPILQAVLDTYINRVRSEREDESRGLRQVYRTERDRAEQTIDRLEQQLARFPRESRLASLESELEESRATQRALRSEHTALRMNLDQARQQRRRLEQVQAVGELEPTARAVQEVEARGAVQRMVQRIHSLRAEKRRLEARFGPEHYQIRDLEDQLNAAETEKRQTVQRLLQERHAGQLEEATQTVEALEARLAAIEPDLEEARLRVQDLHEQTSEQRDRHQRLRERLEQARMDRQRYDQQLTELRVQSTRPDAVRAQVWEQPSSPRLASPLPAVVIPATALLIIGAGIGGLFLRESLDQRLKTPADVQLVREAELLGLVPDAQEDPSGTGRIEQAVVHHPTGLLAEAFRQVRTTLMAKMDRRGHGTLLIAGARPSAGASSVAHNLACSLAYHGRRVLLIDADIRRPTQHEICGLAQSPGLVEVLRHTAQLSDAVTPMEDLSLSVLPAGDLHSVPPELLASEAFEELLTQLQGRYELIVLDGPPVLLASDTQLLARHVDAMALVARAERDERGTIERMLRQLEGQGGEVLGLILNGVRSTAGGYFRKSYREFYRYSLNGVHKRNGQSPPALPQRTPVAEPEHADRA